jgi:hypothetical protein
MVSPPQKGASEGGTSRHRNLAPRPARRLLAVVATPLLTKALVGALIPVSVRGLLVSTLQARAAFTRPKP